ncbi:MAG: FKBP-type peptidyl-prolyl cis-trans isomerase [Thermoplasmata archaeon]
MSPHAAADPSPAKSGDLVQLDYELWAESGGKTELIDTTREEVAQHADLKVPEGHTFGAHPHLIGGDYFPPGVENALIGAKFGEEFSKEFAPADAFGERDPKLIELFSMHEISRLPEMRREDADLDVGTILTIKGRRGRVVTLTAARVRVDFNPPFAGRKVSGKFKLEGRIVETTEQVRALVELTYGRSTEFGVEVHNDVVTLKVPERSKFDFGWMASKPRVIDRIRTHVKPKAIHVVEEYVTPPAKEKEAPKEKKEGTAKGTADAAADAPTATPASGAPSHGHAHSTKPAGAAPAAKTE